MFLYVDGQFSHYSLKKLSFPTSVHIETGLQELRPSVMKSRPAIVVFNSAERGLWAKNLDSLSFFPL